METLGHFQISLTLDTYSHVVPGLQADATNRMQGLSGRLAVRMAVKPTKALRLPSRNGRNPEEKKW
jgi:hypothetical protein